MIELIQFPWSPYCLVQRRILEYGGVSHKVVNIPSTDRSLVWRLTRERYYQVPVLKRGRTVLFETGDDSQVIAKYLDSEFDLGLFPERWAGIQRVLWRYVENDVETLTFQLNDAHFREFVPRKEQMSYMRHKERKFGRGCIEEWKKNQRAKVTQLTELLVPFELMLGKGRRFLLDEQPRFLDFDLWGMLSNFLYSGHYRLPGRHRRLGAWYERVGEVGRQ